MAKTIKFNLICDDKPVRTIEDLQNNFSIEDVLTYYNNKLLHRWLEVRGYIEELEKVNGITAQKSVEIIKELIKIFSVICDDKKVEESVYILEFLDEHQFLCSEYKKENYKTRNIIDDYQTGYRQLVDGILENPDDVAQIKANITEMVNNYDWVFELNHRDLFWNLLDKSTLAVMCLVMNSQSRNYYLPVKEDVVEKIAEDEESSLGSLFNSKLKVSLSGITGSTSTTDHEHVELCDDKAKMFQEICELIQTADFKEKIGDSLVSFAGVTDGYWKDLEPKGKKYMIVSMGSGDYVRSAGVSGGDLSCEDTLNQFVIVDGIDYKSNSAAHQLLYMEV